MSGVFWAAFKTFQNTHKPFWCVEHRLAAWKVELCIRHAFHQHQKRVWAYHIADRRENFSPLVPKNSTLWFGCGHRLCRFCYKTSASSSSCKASETRKPKKTVETSGCVASFRNPTFSKQVRKNMMFWKWNLLDSIKWTNRLSSGEIVGEEAMSKVCLGVYMSDFLALLSLFDMHQI